MFNVKRIKTRTGKGGGGKEQLAYERTALGIMRRQGSHRADPEEYSLEAHAWGKNRKVGGERKGETPEVTGLLQKTIGENLYASAVASTGCRLE